ncbi:IclR family transcriptional regulator [Nocardia sp. NPDC049190]|uniref:IclR family transcriptional regulator n=1 Tax=Nocardia sp. NPDC049190 TaxID=3155650 RepID=UPI0033E3EF32
MGTSSDVPALRRGLAVLQLLASRAGPISATTIARELGLPRSSTYHLLAELEAARFVTRISAERRYGLGIAAFELGTAALRHDPLQRLARPLLRELVEQVGHNAHLGILAGNELLYLIKEQPRRPETLVTGVGVRLPAHLTASGRAILAHLPAAQVRALYPSAAAFVRRTDRGPTTLAALRSTLATERRRGWACEDGHVTPGFASVAYPVFEHNHRPIAAISVALRHHCATIPCTVDWTPLAAQVRTAATTLTHRIGGVPGWT